jgi:hypothetical protein
MPISQGLQMRETRTAPLVKMYEKRPRGSPGIDGGLRSAMSVAAVRGAQPGRAQKAASARDVPLRPSECMQDTMLQMVWTTQKRRMTRTMRWMMVR